MRDYATFNLNIVANSDDFNLSDLQNKLILYRILQTGYAYTILSRSVYSEMLATVKNPIKLQCGDCGLAKVWR